MTALAFVRFTAPNWPTFWFVYFMFVAAFAAGRVRAEFNRLINPTHEGEARRWELQDERCSLSLLVYRPSYVHLPSSDSPIEFDPTQVWSL
jgi:hypothetical protein